MESSQFIIKVKLIHGYEIIADIRNHEGVDVDMAAYSDGVFLALYSDMYPVALPDLAVSDDLLERLTVFCKQHFLGHIDIWPDSAYSYSIYDADVTNYSLKLIKHTDELDFDSTSLRIKSEISANGLFMLIVDNVESTIQFYKRSIVQ